MTTHNHSFTSSGSTSIMILGSSLVTPLNRRRSILFHLRHKVGDMSIYKLERYFVEYISGMIQDDKRKQKSNDKDLER